MKFPSLNLRVLRCVLVLLFVVVVGSGAQAEDELKSDKLRFTLNNGAGFCVQMIQIKDTGEKQINEDNTNFCAPGQSRVKAKQIPEPGGWNDEYWLEYTVQGQGGVESCDMVRVWTEDKDGVRRITKYRIKSTGKLGTFNDKNNPQMVTFVFEVTGTTFAKTCKFKDVKRRKL